MELKLNGRSNKQSIIILVPKLNKSWTPNMNMISSCSNSPNFPFDPPINLDHHSNRPGFLIFGKKGTIVGSNGDVGSVNKRRPNVRVFVALISIRDSCVICDLLAMVRGVNTEFIVVDADFVVRVSGPNGDLELGGEEVGRRDVEVEDCGVLEHETGFMGLENCPCYEDDEEDDEDDDGGDDTDAPGSLSPLVFVAVAVFGHG